MILDNIESQGLRIEKLDTRAHFKELNSGLSIENVPDNGCYQRIPHSFDQRLAEIIGVKDVSKIETLHPSIMDQARELLYGVERDGYKTLGLNDVYKYKINHEYYNSNIKQQAGFSAEILSTWKENLAAQAEGTGITTYRADDLPELFPRNDQYVDKVRMNSEGEIIERIQTKFIGGGGKKWLSKMMSPKFEKYLDGKVDKLECPKDYYNDIKEAIPERIQTYEKQLDKVTAEGKTDVAELIQHRIDKLKKIDSMVEQSNTTYNEAKFARLHPKCAAAKPFVSATVKLSNREGLSGGAAAAGLTFAVSTVDHLSSYVRGDITAEDMVKDITKETAASGALGYGTQFVTSAVSQTMRASSCQFIQHIGGTCLPAAAVSFAVESYDSISSFAQGKIDGAALAYDLGENSTVITGGMAGAKAGAIVGSAAGPAGTAAGSVIGGMVGCAVTSEVYRTAIEAGSEHVDEIVKTAQGFADSTIGAIADTAPEQLDAAKSAFNDFADSVKIPIHV